MSKKSRPAQEAGRPPPPPGLPGPHALAVPRVALAIAATAVAVVVHAAVIGLFDQEARRQVQLAAAVGAPALAACQRDPDRARQRACMRAALAHSRSVAAVALAPGR